MTVVSITTAKNAKTGGERTCGGSAISSVAFSKFLSVLKAAWPKKTAVNVAHITGTSERTVQFWLAGETRMSIDAVVALLKTDAGFDILNAILGDECKANWWLVTKSAQNIRTSKKAIKREEQRIAATRAQLDLLDND